MPKDCLPTKKKLTIGLTKALQPALVTSNIVTSTVTVKLTMKTKQLSVVPVYRKSCTDIHSVQNIKALTSACFYKEPDIPISISDKTQAVLLTVEYVSHSKMINPGKTIFIHGQQTIPIRMPNTHVYPLLKE